MIAFQMIAALFAGLCLLANFGVMAILNDGWRRGEHDPRLFSVSCSLVAAPLIIVAVAVSL